MEKNKPLLRNTNCYTVLLLLVISLNITCLTAQSKLLTKSKKAIESYEFAKADYYRGKYDQALTNINQAISKDKRFIEAHLLKAEIFFSTHRYQNEKDAWLNVISIDSFYYKPAYYNLGVVDFNLGNYDQSEIWFNKYNQLSQGDKNKIKTSSWLLRISFAKEAVYNPKQVLPVNAGPQINSRYDEYWPSLTADEKTMVFTVLVPRDSIAFLSGQMSKTASNFQEDFYLSINKNGWQMRETALSPLNSPNNEGAQTLSADGNMMFFTACGRSGGLGSCDIWFSRRINNGWSQPLNIGAPVNTPFWESQPSFSSDGKTLFFVSNRTGGYGKKDIWQASIVGFRDDSTPIFGQLTNLGEMINTDGDENSPFMHFDNQTLYFSSDGWPGMGQMDLFLSHRDSLNNWHEPKNLGYPINSSNDEIGLIVNASGNKAYYSSDGLTDGYGGKDIYWFDLPVDLKPNPVSYVKGEIYDDETKLPLKADFELINLKSKKTEIESQSRADDGSFLLCLAPGNNYGLNVSKKDYLFYSGNFNLEKVHGLQDPKTLVIYLKPIKKGSSIILENVFFDTDSFNLRPESDVELQKIVQFLSVNTTLSVEIQGHTDNVGNAQYNLDLSTKRALSVYSYLKVNGVQPSRLQYKGFGMQVPISDNTSPEGRAKNRRTEMVVIK